MAGKMVQHSKDRHHHTYDDPAELTTVEARQADRRKMNVVVLLISVTLAALVAAIGVLAFWST